MMQPTRNYHYFFLCVYNNQNEQFFIAEIVFYVFEKEEKKER